MGTHPSVKSVKSAVALPELASARTTRYPARRMSSGIEARPPRWLRFAPFLGQPPPLSPRQWQVLGLVSIATLFDQYDRALFALALPQIQSSLGIGEADVGWLGSI